MTDRSVQVTIGAVLASSFRSTFRDAGREVASFSRSLDVLNGRRSNAGLFAVRDASTAARTSLRGLRTEVGVTARALDTVPTHAARATTALRGMATEARAAAAGVQALGTAMRGLSSGSSTTNLGRMNTATRATRTNRPRTSDARRQATSSRPTTMRPTSVARHSIGLRNGIPLDVAPR